MALRKIHNTYYVYYRDVDGKLKTRSLKTTDATLARRLHDDYILQLQAKKGRAVIMRDFPELKPPPELPKPATGEHQRGGIKIADMWECAVKKRALSINHKKIWDVFVQRIGVKYADQITPAIALQYLEDNYNSGNGKTYNNVKSSLNTIYRCCLVEANLSASPFQAIINKRVTEVETHRNLTLDEFQRLMDVIPVHMQIVAMLSRWTTQRLETCTRITPEMLDFGKKVFIVDPGKTRRFGKWVCCPIMPELEKFLLPLLPKCKPNIPIVKNFSEWKNTRYTNVFTKYMRELKINDNSSGKASFHSIRGTAITWFKEHGVKGEELRSITGHASADVEDIYARDIASISKIAQSFSCM
jgi:integrase family protein|nr:MAG TPA: Integrase [Caudoviricetes sp.]